MVVLDFDDTEDRVHAKQERALFNGYYDEYCFLPLHVYEGLSGRLITTQAQGLARQAGPGALAPARRAPAQGLAEDVDPVSRRQSFCLSSGDGLHRESAEYGLCDRFADQFSPQTPGRRGGRRGAAALSLPAIGPEHPVKVTRFHSVRYRAGTWSRWRRVVIKVEVTEQGVNTRFVVTDREQARASVLYRQIYCSRGTAEGYIKDHKLYLKSDRTSCHRFEANQFRLLLHSAAYVRDPASGGVAGHGVVACYDGDVALEAAQDRGACAAVKDAHRGGLAHVVPG